MPTREQLTAERVTELITELGEAGVIDTVEAERLNATRDFAEAGEVRESTPEPPALTRAKVSQGSRDRFESAFSAGDTEECLALIWEVLTGEDVRSGGN